MKLSLKDGLRLSAAVLFVIVGTAPAFAQLEHDTKVEAGKGKAEAKRLETDSKGGKSATAEAVRAERDRKSGVDRTLRGNRTASDLLAQNNVDFKDQVDAINQYVAKAHANSAADATVQKSEVIIKDAIKTLKSSTMPYPERLERMEALSIYAKFYNTAKAGSPVYSPKGVATMAHLAHALTAHSKMAEGAPGMDQATIAQVLKFDKVSKADKIASAKAYESSSLKTEMTALIKISGELVSDRSKMMEGQLNSSKDAAVVEAALTNINDIITRFDKNMTEGSFPTSKEAMLRAVVDWARDNNKDVARAIICATNPSA